MLRFFNWIIGKIGRMNLEFQSEKFRLSTLYSSITDEYRSILAFIKDEILKSFKLSKINPENKSVHLSVENISLGGRCEMLLLKEPLKEREKRFRHDCLKFMTELCAQIRKRFPITEEESILALLNVLDPEEALSPERHMKSISKLAVHFPNLIEEEQLDELQEQWRDLLYFSTSLGQLSKTAIPF